MSGYRVADQREQEILRANRMDPREYAVMGAGDGWIRVLCYRTRDVLTINEGDKKWMEGR